MQLVWKKWFDTPLSLSNGRLFWKGRGGGKKGCWRWNAISGPKLLVHPSLPKADCQHLNSIFLQVRARLRGRFSKDGYLEIPVIVACSDGDHSAKQVQQNDHALLTHGRQRRTKGTFFCLTKATNFSRGDLGNSNYELRDQEEVDGFTKSLVLRTNRTRKDNFERHNSDSSSSLSNSVFTPRRQSDTSYFVNNGQFKRISMV